MITKRKLAIVTAVVIAQIFLWVVLLEKVLIHNHTFVSIGDSASQSLCWLGKIFEAIRRSKIVLWDFTTQAGISFIGELQTAPLYPLALFFGLVANPELPRTVDLFLSVHFLIAAFGLFAFGRQIGLSNPASFLSSAIYAYGTTYTIRVNGQPNLFVSLSWMPWIIWGAHSAVTSITRRDFFIYCFASAFFLGFCFLAGHVHAVVISCIISVVFNFSQIVIERKKRDFLKLFMWGFTSSVLALLLTLPQILATQEYMKLSYKWYGPGYTEWPHVVPFKEFVRHHLHLADISTIITGCSVNALDGGTLYFTLTGLFLSAGSLFFLGKQSLLRGPLIACLVTMACSLAFAFSATWPFGLIFNKIPLVNLIRVPARGLFAFGFAASLLAGFGLDAILVAINYIKITHKQLSVFKSIVLLIVILLLACELLKWTPSHTSRKTESELSGVNLTLNDPMINKLKELSASAGSCYRYYAAGEDAPANAPNLFSLLSVNGYRSSRTKAFHEYFDFNPMSEKADALGIKWWVSRNRIKDLPIVANINGKFLHERNAPPVFWQQSKDNNKHGLVIEKITWEPNSVLVHLKKPVMGLIVFGQVFYPGFKCFADGKEVPIMSYTHLMAIDLKKPIRDLNFVYRPKWLLPSLLISATTMVFIIVTYVLILQSKKSRSVKV